MDNWCWMIRRQCGRTRCLLHRVQLACSPCNARTYTQISCLCSSRGDDQHGERLAFHQGTWAGYTHTVASPELNRQTQHDIHTYHIQPNRYTLVCPALNRHPAAVFSSCRVGLRPPQHRPCGDPLGENRTNKTPEEEKATGSHPAIVHPLPHAHLSPGCLSSPLTNTSPSYGTSATLPFPPA